MSQEAVRTLRTLLRAVNNNVTSKNKNVQWRNYILSKYREHQHEQDPAVAARLRSSANDYSVMFKSTMTRQELVDRYNSSSAQDDIVAKSARRVGLALPRITGEDFNEPLQPAGAAKEA